MLNLLGEYRCKVDAKGRMMFPASLRKELSEVLHHGLVINRDIFESCIVLYPRPEWDRVNKEMSKLSRYNRKHQQFQRRFMMGASQVSVDNSGRLLLPAMLQEHAGIDLKASNEVVVSAMGEKIEVWSLANYQAKIAEDDNFDELAEEIGRDIEQLGRED